MYVGGMRILVLFVALAVAVTAAADPPWYIDDEKGADTFFDKLADLACHDKCLKPAEMKQKLNQTTAKVALVQPGDKALTPEEVYAQALDSVFVIGSVDQSEETPGKWNDGRLATAWAVAADGVLVTNWHVFDQLRDERFGAANRQGEVFPLVDVLASNRDNDVAVVRISAKGLRPLAIGKDEKVGAWVSVLGHPGEQLFTFTQGNVTRYTQMILDGKRTHWMSVTAEFAYGASGAPVLNRQGAVAGMATVTSNIDYPQDDGPVREKDHHRVTRIDGGRRQACGLPRIRRHAMMVRPAQANPEEGSMVQMVVKLVVPSEAIRDLCREPSVEKPAAKPPAKP